MRPTLIPDELVMPGVRRIVIGPPGGDLTSTDIAPVEAVVATSESGHTEIGVRLALEPGDLERLQAGEHIWLTVLSQRLAPFSIDVGP